MADLVQFTDGIGGAVLLDLNAAPWLVTAIDVSPPQARQAYVASMLVDGAELAASAYENRTVRLTVELDGSGTAAARETALQALRRRLTVSGWLKVQLEGAATPVWFRTFVAPDAAQTLLNGLRFVSFDLSVPAEPFAYGAKETLTSAVISADPAAGTNPCYMAIPGTVKGDVPTPAHVTFTPSSVAYPWELVASSVTRPGAGFAGLTLLAQGEAGTMLDADTSVVAAAGYSGTGYARTTFATDPVYKGRVNLGYLPSPRLSPTVAARGTYRVMAAVATAAGSGVSVLDVGWYYVDTFGSSYKRRVSVDAADGLTVLDLGLLQVPAGAGARSGGYGAELPPLAFELSFAAGRVSGSGSLQLDWLMLLPVGESAGVMRGSVPNRMVADGPQRSWYPVNDLAGAVALSVAPEAVPAEYARSGGLPQLVPGEANQRLYVVWRRRSGSPRWDKTVTVTADVAYWPRYLSVLGA